MSIIITVAVIAAVVIITAGICVVRAVVIKKEYADGRPFSMVDESIDYKKHSLNLSKMIQIPTVSVRGSDDKTQIYRFHKLLEELYPNIHKKAQKIDIDGALLFRWAGKNPSEKPILLMSHMDVVEAGDRDNWKYDPFSGAIEDGKIWGRGTIDTKGALCAILEAVEHLISEGFTPYCDVYVASSNNEEITGDGAVKTVEYLNERGIELALVMDEGGSVMANMSGVMSGNSAMVGIFEKGRANIKFIADSPGGHASTPFRETPFARLAKLMYTVEYKNPFKKKITPPVKHMYKSMAPYMPFKYRIIFGNLWLFGPLLPPLLGKLGGQAAALVSTTCVFTMAEGSHGANVIPQRASVTANMRFMIHEGLPQSYAKMAKIAKKLHINMEMITGFDYSDVADMDTYAYKYVNSEIKKMFGDIPIVPYVMLAGTDSRHYTKICKCVLRFVPLMMTGAQLASAHAQNENIHEESLARGVLFYVDFIKNYGGDVNML